MIPTLPVQVPSAAVLAPAVEARRSSLAPRQRPSAAAAFSTRLAPAVEFRSAAAAVRRSGDESVADNLLFLQFFLVVCLRCFYFFFVKLYINTFYSLVVSLSFDLI